MKKQRFFLIALLLTSGALSFGCGQGFFAPYSGEEYCNIKNKNKNPSYNHFVPVYNPFAPGGDVFSSSPPKVAGEDTEKSSKELQNAIAAVQACKINNEDSKDIEKALAMLEQKELEKNKNNCK